MQLCLHPLLWTCVFTRAEASGKGGGGRKRPPDQKVLEKLAEVGWGMAIVYPRLCGMILVQMGLKIGGHKKSIGSPPLL